MLGLTKKKTRGRKRSDWEEGRMEEKSDERRRGKGGESERRLGLREECLLGYNLTILMKFIIMKGNEKNSREMIKK